jgi:hypothetical protein
MVAFFTGDLLPEGMLRMLKDHRTASIVQQDAPGHVFAGLWQQVPRHSHHRQNDCQQRYGKVTLLQGRTFFAISIFRRKHRPAVWASRSCRAAPACALPAAALPASPYVPTLQQHHDETAPYSISRLKMYIFNLFAAVISRKKHDFSIHWARLSACAANRAFA